MKEDSDFFFMCKYNTTAKSTFLPVPSPADTVRCYGNDIRKTIGGTREPIDRTFDCPTCLQQTLCISNGHCFHLNATALHVFEDGLLTQPPILLDSRCVPESLSDSFFDPGFLILVKCRPVGSRFQPSYQRILLNDEGTAFEAEEFVTLSYADNDYLGSQENFVIAPGHNDEIESDDFIVSILATSNGNEILVQTDSGYLDLKVRVSNCGSIERLHPGPAYNGDTLQIVVDCIHNGELTRQRLLLPASELRSGRGGVNVVKLYTPMGNDTVVFSPDNAYILYQGVTQIVLIKSNEPSATPGIISFTGPIAEAGFVNNTLLLLSIPGQDRTLLDIEQFFSSNFDDGMYTLLNSGAFCPLGDCSPYVLNDNQLFLFTKNSQTPFYLNLVVYNLSDPSVQPESLGKTLRADSMEICFHDVLNITAEVSTPPVTTPQTTTTNSSPPPVMTSGSTTPPPVVTSGSTTPPPVVTSTSRTGGISSPSPSLDSGVIVAIVIAVLLFSAAIIALTVFVIIAVVKKHPKSRKTSQQETDHSHQPRVSVIVEDLPRSSKTDYATSSACSSNIPSLACSTVSLPTTGVIVVNPKKETVVKHLDVPTPSKDGSIATAERVV